MIINPKPVPVLPEWLNHRTYVMTNSGECKNFSHWHVVVLPLAKFAYVQTTCFIAIEPDLLEWLNEVEGLIEFCLHKKDPPDGEICAVACFENRREAAEFKLRWAGVL